jgi:hypothetical protein
MLAKLHNFEKLHFDVMAARKACGNYVHAPKSAVKSRTVAESNPLGHQRWTQRDCCFSRQAVPARQRHQPFNFTVAYAPFTQRRSGLCQVVQRGAVTAA